MAFGAAAGKSPVQIPEEKTRKSGRGDKDMRNKKSRCQMADTDRVVGQVEAAIIVMEVD
jgi:hypothetical protein